MPIRAKVIFGLAILLIFGSNVTFGQTIKIIAKVPATTSPADTIYVTGNLPELCSWNPKCVRLNPIGNWIYSAEFSVESKKTDFEFKITRGSWDTEATNSKQIPYKNFHASLEESEIVVDVLNWKDLRKGVTGRLTTFENFFSPQLGNARTVRVWVPAHYDPTNAQRYPVIYMHDGQNLFDPETSAFGTEWEIDERVSALMDSGSTNGAIVVGIDNSKNRMDEYDYARKGYAYAKFLIDTVKPFIDREFRTFTDRNSTFTMGSSAGAVISLALAWKHSNIFSRAAGVSFPAHMHDYVTYSIVDSSPIPTLPVSLYFDWGNYDGDANYPGPAKAFVKHLTDIGFPKERLVAREFAYAGHFESDWARRAEIPLSWLLK